MADYHFHRECRTPYSEGYTIGGKEGEEIGRVDVHFTGSIANASLVVDEKLTEEEVEELIGVIDEEIVMSWDPDRLDFIINVYRGKESAVYSDEDFEEEWEEGEGEGEGDGQESEDKD